MEHVKTKKITDQTAYRGLYALEAADGRLVADHWSVGVTQGGRPRLYETLAQAEQAKGDIDETVRVVKLT